MYPTIPRLLEPLSLPFKRSQLGLFHGALKQSGNNVPFSKKKTKRTWLPNVQQKKLSLATSATSKETVKIKVTTRALRTIEKSGGLANYVQNTRHDILGPMGMALRLKIRDAQAAEEAERARRLERRAQLRWEAQVNLNRLWRSKVENREKKLVKAGKTPGDALSTA